MIMSFATVKVLEVIKSNSWQANFSGVVGGVGGGRAGGGDD